ncbi:MAG: SPOR domain-containing protein [Rhodoferax sp.]
MTDADQPAAPAVAEEDITSSLYRAAIGPVGADYYVPIFNRFEEANHAGITWNTTAALFTLHWLLFRQLYVYALAYACAVLTVVLLVFGIGRVLFDFPDGLLIALGVGFGSMAFALPGLFGNALLHTECRKRMAAAVAAHQNMGDARAALQAKASTRRRGIVLAAMQAALALLIALAVWFATELTSVQPAPSEPVAPTRAVSQSITTAPVADSTAHPAASGSIGLAASASAAPPGMPSSAASASAPAPAASAPASAAASAPASVPASAPTSSAARAPSMPASTGSAPVVPASTPVSAPPPAPTAKVASAAPPAAPVAAAASKPRPIASDPDKAKQRKALQSALKPTDTAKPAAKSEPKPKAQAKAPTKPAAATAPTKPYYINVGLFAVTENVERVQGKLQGAQLPVVVTALKSKKGPLTRVRVGPFNNELEAQAAAQKVKGLQLDAVVVQP